MYLPPILTIRERMVLERRLRCLLASNPITWFYSSSLRVGIGEESKSIPDAITASIASAPMVVVFILLVSAFMAVWRIFVYVNLFLILPAWVYF